LKSYRHGNTFNFIFERAKTNLGCYLREERYGASSGRPMPAESNPLWIQALGVAKALSHVINYMPPSDGQPGRPLHGYHFDLKPANVLVEYDGTLIISDFGQARFQQIGDTSRITPVGGTEAYAPPEIDTHADRFNRKYDVWSLGCMFLEICVFVVAGHQGVKALDQSRLTKRGNVIDDRFFIRVSGGVHELKPEIIHYIENLRRSESIQASRTNDFLLEILALVTHMLQPVISRRMTAQEVCQRLESITMRYQPPLDSIHLPSIQQIILHQGDTEYAPHITKSIRTMMYYHNHRWLAGRLKIVEDDVHNINFVSSTDFTQVRINIGSRASVKIVPRFANRSRSPEEFLDCHMYFMNSGFETGTDGVSATKLHFRNPAECSLAYSVFIGQDILCSSRIRQCTVNRQESLRRRLSRYDSGLITDVPSTVELWSENSHLHPVSPSRPHLHRSVRHTTFAEPAHRRIVVYFEKSILLIRFAKNVRIKHAGKEDPPNMVTLIPTEPNRDPTFTVSLFKGRDSETAVAIPISSTHLEQEEEEQKFECRSVQIGFEHERERRAFFGNYRRMKDDWRNENKQLEDLRKNMGPLIGYAMN
jgi:serine/threonine protein kinase